MPIENRIRNLKLSAGFIAGFGIFALLVVFDFSKPLLNLFLDLTYLPYNGEPTHDGRSSDILFAITGGLTMFVAVQIYCVAHWMMESQPELGRKLILYPLVTWFICDSTASIAVGAWFNAILNLTFLLPPMLALKGIGAGVQDGVAAGSS